MHPCEPIRRAGLEVLSVGLGFGILGYQRLQVQRREWERTSGMTLPSSREVAETLSSALGDLNSLLGGFGRR
jgi:hypothetical protein